jgi:tetratricopeptide (TPR) repeat protein
MARPKEALHSTQRALELNPVYAKAWTNRANALLELGQPDAAIDAAARALELDTGLPGAYVALYAACMELGRVSDAEAALSRGLAVFPDNELLRENRDRLAAYKQDHK